MNKTTTRLFVMVALGLGATAPVLGCDASANNTAVKSPKKASTVKTKKDSPVVASQAESRPASETPAK